MAAFYPLFVLAHLVGLVLFAMAHGASAFMAFRLRSERDPAVVESLLKVGQLSIGPMYIGLVMLGIGGLGAAAGANLWGQPWIIASRSAARTAARRSNLRRWRACSTRGVLRSSPQWEPSGWSCSSG